MLKKNKITKVLCMVIALLSISCAMGSNLAYANSNTLLSDMNIGDVVEFAGKEWIVINPQTGLIVLKVNDGNRAWDEGNVNDYVSSDIREYLNGIFLDSLGDANKTLLQDWIWNVGNHKNEAEKTVTDKVGLLTKSEYEAVRGVAFPQDGEKYRWWSITRDSMDSNDVFSINESGNFNDSDSKFSYGVRPALHLKSGIFVSDGKITEDQGNAMILNIEPQKEKITVGEEVVTDVIIDNITEIAAEDIKIKYDNQKLEFLGFEEVTEMKLVKSVEQTASGDLRVLVASKGEDNIINSKKVLLKLKFKGIHEGEAIVDITKGRVTDGVEMEKDLTEEECGQATILIEKPKDVNNTGEFTLLDLGIDARHFSKDPASSELDKYNTDIVVNGEIDDEDLLEIGRLILENPNYTPNN